MANKKKTAGTVSKDDQCFPWSFLPAVIQLQERGIVYLKATS